MSIPIQNLSQITHLSSQQILAYLNHNQKLKRASLVSSPKYKTVHFNDHYLAQLLHYLTEAIKHSNEPEQSSTQSQPTLTPQQKKSQQIYALVQNLRQSLQSAYQEIDILHRQVIGLLGSQIHEYRIQATTQAKPKESQPSASKAKPKAKHHNPNHQHVLTPNDYSNFGL